jgi:hypothetical protein
MHFKNFIATSLFLGMAIGFGSCASDSDRETELQEERIVKLLDEKRYQDVVYLLEKEATLEERKKYDLYLGQAYLGLANFEPMALSVNVLGDQGASHPHVDALIPGCSKAAQARASTVSTRCILWRLFRQLPSHDEPNFVKGQQILREKFKNPSKTRPGYNLLVTLVDASSTFSRLKRTLKVYEDLDPTDSTDAAIQGLFGEISGTVIDADLLLRRAQHIPDLRVYEHLTGLETDTIFNSQALGLSQGKNFGPSHSLDFLEKTGIPLVKQIADDSIADTIQTLAAKILIIQELDEFTQSLKKEF